MQLYCMFASIHYHHISLGWTKTKYANITSSDTTTHLILQHLQQVVIVVAPVNHHHPQAEEYKTRGQTLQQAGRFTLHTQTEWNILSSTWKRRCNHPTELLTWILFCSSHTGTRAWYTSRQPLGDTLKTHWHTDTHSSECYACTCTPQTQSRSYSSEMKTQQLNEIQQFVHVLLMI